MFSNLQVGEDGATNHFVWRRSWDTFGLQRDYVWVRYLGRPAMAGGHWVTHAQQWDCDASNGTHLNQVTHAMPANGSIALGPHEGTAREPRHPLLAAEVR